MKKQPNEEEIYKRILLEGFTRDGNPSFAELLSLAKHIRQKEGFGERNIVRWLTDFCKKEDEFFNGITSEGLLASVARAAIKNTEWRKINFPIKIVQDEVNAIRKVKSYKHQLLLLSSLVVAKSTGNQRIFSTNSTLIAHIIELSGQPYSIKLFIDELIRVANINKVFESVVNKREFFVLTSGASGDVVIEIKDENDYYSLSEIYQKFIGGELSWCADCFVEIIKSGKRHKYCGDCSKKRIQERERKRVRKR